MIVQVTISGVELRTIIENAIVKNVGTKDIGETTILINVDGGNLSYDVLDVTVTATVPEKKS